MTELEMATIQHHSEKKAWDSYFSDRPILRIGSILMLASKLFYIFQRRYDSLASGHTLR